MTLDGAAMYFVTIGGQVGYVLFATTPNGRAAVGITDKGMVRLLAPSKSGEWSVLREWPTSTYSHTDFMLAVASRAEPEKAEELLAILPPETLS
jgi:hypothetical protein